MRFRRWPGNVCKRESRARCAREGSGQLRGVIDFPGRAFDRDMVARGRRTNEGRQREELAVVLEGDENGSVTVAAGVLDRTIGVIGVSGFRRIGALAGRVLVELANGSLVRVLDGMAELRRTNQANDEDPK